MIVPSYWEPIMGGAQYQAKVLLERMVERGGFELHYLARRLPDNKQPTDHGLHRIGRSINMSFLRDTPTLLAKLEELQPDTIWCHVGCAYVGIAAWYCRSHNTRLVWHLASDIDAEPWTLRQRHNPIMSFFDKKVMEYGLRKATAIVAQTEEQVALMEKHYGRKPDVVIKNFHPALTQSLTKATKTEVLWVANLKFVKQPQLFVELAQKLSTLDAQFTMIGGMQLTGAAKEQFLRSVDATANLTWLGAMPQDEVNVRMSAAHLLVNTSSFEGFSNTFIQAWLREAPVCSLNVDPDELLSKGGLGFCADGQLDALAEAVANYATHPAERHATGQLARTYAETNHGMAAADQLITLLSSQPTRKLKQEIS